mgnify:CR=1 FL=1
MEEDTVKRHNMVFITGVGKEILWEQIYRSCSSHTLDMLDDLLHGTTDIPCIVRRDEIKHDLLPVGLVHPFRINENRKRFAGHVPFSEVLRVVTPYALLSASLVPPRNICIKDAYTIRELAKIYGIRIGILGSAAMEFATGLSYTDSLSDLDFLLRPASLHLLQEFYEASRDMVTVEELDFEVEFPNGYGVKLVEFFMDTKSVLAKSMEDVVIIEKKELLPYFYELA